VREFAKRSLREIAQWYEESTARGTGGSDPNHRLSKDRAREMIATITRNPGAAYPYEVWRAFHDMRVLTGWNVEVFDSRAAVQWCAEHKPKCDE
jgi:hypothetical protein